MYVDFCRHSIARASANVDLVAQQLQEMDVVRQQILQLEQLHQGMKAK